MNNDFNISIGVKLDSSNIKNEINNIQSLINKENNLKLNINFNNKEVISQIKDVGKVLQSIEGKKNLQIFDAKSLDYQIQGTLKSLDQVKSALRDMGLYSKGEVKINVTGIDKSTQEINKFVATIKDTQGIMQQINFSQARLSGLGEGESSLVGYAGQLTKISDTTDKVTKKATEDLEEFKNKYESILNSLRSYNVPVESIDKISESLDKLNLKSKEIDFTNIKNQVSELQRVVSFGNSINGNGININSNTQEIENFIKTITNGKAQLNSINQSIDQFGNKIKTVTYDVAEGTNRIERFKMTIDQSSNGVYNASNGVKTLSDAHKNMNNGIMDSVASLAKFTIASTVLYGTYKQLGEMVSYINDQNSKMVNIAMVGDYSLSQVKDITKGYSELATQLHSTNKEVLDAAENFLRAGNSVEASKNLIKASTIGSAISGQTNEQTSEQLIAISNGFKMNTEDGKALINVIDQISTADNKSATSFAEISNAMKNCSNSAQTAKVDLTHLVAYLSVVESVTRKNASSIGESFKAQFARYENVKGGKNFDETGDLSNVERDLNKYAGIKIRSDVGTFKSYEETIDSLKAKWGSLSEVARAAISKAMAGVTHAEDFQALMNNMDKVDKMLGDLGNSAGSAEKKFNGLFSDSTKAHIADMKHAQEELFESFMDSKKINVAIDGITKFINTLNVMTSTEKLSAAEMIATSTAIVLLIKNFSKLSVEVELFNTIAKGVGVTNAITGTMSAFGTSIAKTGASLLAFATNPVTLTILGLGALTGAIISHINHQADLKKTTDSLAQSFQDLTKAMADNNVESMKNDLKTLEQQQKKLNDLLKQKAELEAKMKSPSTTYDPRIDSAINNADASKLKEITQVIEEQKKVMKEAGVNQSVLTNAKIAVTANDNIEAIKKETEVQINHNNEIIKQIQEYQNLASSKDENNTKTQRMSQLANELSVSIQGLVTEKDKDGNVTIQNTSLLDGQIDMLNTENSTIKTSMKTKIDEQKQNTEWQVGNTKMAYKQISARIGMYQKEIDKIQEMILKKQYSETGMSADGTKLAPTLGELSRKLGGMQVEESFAKDAKNSIDAIFNQAMGSVGGLTNELNDGYTPASDDATKKTKKNTEATKENTEAIDAAKEAVKKYENELKALDNILYQLEANMSGMNDASENYRNSLYEEVNILKQKNDLLKNSISVNEKYASSLGSLAGSGAGSALGQTVVNEAMKYLNTPYKWTGDDPTDGGFDCSGLIQYIYKQIGISIGRTTYDQVKEGVEVSKDELQPGDIIFFGSSSSPHHEGLYIGGGTMIESPHTGDVVKESSINRSDYATARRILTGGISAESSSKSASTEYTGTYQSIINEAASNYGVDPNLIAAVIKQESDFNPKSTSGAGAKGLMQLMDGTASSLGVTDSYDVRQNIMGGTKYLKEMIDQFGDIRTAVGHYNSGPAGNLTNSQTANYMNKVMGYYQQYSNGTSSIPNINVHGVVSEIEDLNGKTQDLQRQMIDNTKKIQEIYNQIYQSQIKFYDNQLAHVDRNKEMAQAKYDISKDNITQAGLEESEKQKAQIWKEINWHYSVLNEKEKYITSQLYSNDYDDKTKASMLELLEQVRIEKEKTISDLHEEFKSWIKETYSNSIKPYQSEIEQLQSQLDVLDKKSIKSYGNKILLNNKILLQEEEIKQKTLEKMKVVQDLIDKEKDDNSRQIWKDELDALKKDYDEILQKQIEINQTKIQLVEDSAMDDIQLAIYEGSTQQEYEDIMNGRIQALNQELETLQKRNEKLEESETRQKNLLSLAEAQIKLQDIQNEKNVQQLTKSKDGTWQFSYVADQKEVDSQEKSVRDQIISNRDWESQTTKKHLEESINDQKELLQEEISLRSEAYSRIKENLEKAIENNKDEIIDGTVTISSLINTSLSGINQKYNGKYSGIISDLKSFIDNYTTDLANFNTILQNSLNDISNINSVGSSLVSSSNISAVDKAINNVKNSLSNILGGSSSSGSSSSSTTSSTSTSSNEHGLSTSITVSGNTTTYHYADGYTRVEKYASGGLNSKTGMAWLDGTPENPEYVLNSTDTSKMFNAIDILKDINLPSIKDMLSKLPNISNILPSIKMPDLSSLTANNQPSTIQQHIENHVSFPNAVNHAEIEQAFHTLSLGAIQHANKNVY